MKLIESIKIQIIRNASKYPILFYCIFENFLWFKNLFFSRYKLNRSKDVGPFFIIGSGRSGNTLLRSILTGHTKISIPPESYVLQIVYKKFKINRFLNWDDLSKLIISEFEAHPHFFNWEINLFPVYQRVIHLDKQERTLARIINEIYRYYAEKNFPGAEIWGDKTPLNTLYLFWIHKIFPKAKYVHIIRDGRDVVSSYLKTGIINNINEACWRWNESIRVAMKFKKRKSPKEYLEIRYEELVKNPEEVIKRICKFLQIQFQPRMLDQTRLTHKLGDVKYLKHHENVSKKINKKSIGNWKRNLAGEQKELVQLKLKKYLKILDYI